MWFADSEVKFGFEVDVSTLEAGRTENLDPDIIPVEVGGPTREVDYTPPPPDRVTPTVITPDIVEVRVTDATAGPTLAAAIEIVSPANKHGPAERAAFVAKCETLVRERVGLIVVDPVTRLNANLHRELLRRLSEDGEVDTTVGPLAATAYHVAPAPGKEDGVDDDPARLEVWEAALRVGGPLPTLPLYLKGGPCLPVDLHAAYVSLYRDLRLPVDRPAA